MSDGSTPPTDWDRRQRDQKWRDDMERQMATFERHLAETLGIVKDIQEARQSERLEHERAQGRAEGRALGVKQITIIATLVSIGLGIVASLLALGGVFGA